MAGSPPLASLVFGGPLDHAVLTRAGADDDRNEVRPNNECVPIFETGTLRL